VRRQLADQIREATVVRVPTRLAAKHGNGVVRHTLPVDEECGRAGIEEGEPRRVDGPARFAYISE